MPPPIHLLFVHRHPARRKRNGASGAPRLHAHASCHRRPPAALAKQGCFVAGTGPARPHPPGQSRQPAPPSCRASVLRTGLAPAPCSVSGGRAPRDGGVSSCHRQLYQPSSCSTAATFRPGDRLRWLTPAGASGGSASLVCAVRLHTHLSHRAAAAPARLAPCVPPILNTPPFLRAPSCSPTHRPAMAPARVWEDLRKEVGKRSAGPGDPRHAAGCGVCW